MQLCTGVSWVTHDVVTGRRTRHLLRNVQWGNMIMSISQYLNHAAVLPSGKVQSVFESPLIAVLVGNIRQEAALEEALKQHLVHEARHLDITIQGGGTSAHWHLSIAWGIGSDIRRRGPVVLQDDEHDTESILRKVDAELLQLFSDVA